MIVEREDNSALYFIVGGLLVAVMVFAFFYFRNSGPVDTNTADNQTIVERVVPSAGDSSDNDSHSMSLSVGDEGVRASTTEVDR